jgi:adenylate kinase
VQREDDRPESIRVRVQAYQERIRPLGDYYRRARKLVSVQASGPPEEVLWRSLQVLAGRRAAQPA